jgi:hypothetical protein
MSDTTIRLTPGQTAVIGYGSLLAKISISRMLEREYDAPFLACHVEGWRRSWDVAMPNEAFYYVENDVRTYPRNIVYLNVRRSPGALLNVVLFVVNDDELQAMHGREWIYNPLAVTTDLRGVHIEGGEAIMYGARDEYLVRSNSSRLEAAIRASYLRILSKALDARTAAFRDEYARTTDAVPSDLVIDDTLDPDRPSPWAGYGYKPERQIEE